MYNGTFDLFPGTQANDHSITIAVNPQASIQQVGKEIIKKVGALVERQWGTSLQEVLTSTPKSGLIKKPTSIERLAQKRKIERDFRDEIEKEYKENDLVLVMGNRLSWSTYDKIRKSESLGKRKCSESGEPTPKRKKIHK